MPNIDNIIHTASANENDANKDADSMRGAATNNNALIDGTVNKVLEQRRKIISGKTFSFLCRS